MAVSELSPPPHPTKPTTPSKSYTRFLCKSLTFALFIAVIPLFPSQAPEFITHSLITKFWELLHLLFIGIAVSYGVFSRRNVDRGVETHHSAVESSQSYVSRFFNVSSVFEDGFENSSGSGGEKSMIQAWNSQQFLGESMAVVAGGGSSVLAGRGKPRSSDFENGGNSLCGSERKKTIQTWDSQHQYLRGEAMVVVGEGSYDQYQWGKTESSIDGKPLGLPVRSLKSRIKDTDSSESRSSSRSGSSKSSGKSRNGKLGFSGPLNLEETVALPSPIPWRSRSVKMEMRKEGDSFHSHSHSMPPSLEEPEFEDLQSRSFRSSTPISSQTSSVSSSPRRLSPSSSASSDAGNMKTEEIGMKKSPYASSDATSPSPSPSPSPPPEQMNGNVQSENSRSRRISHGSSPSSSETNGDRGFEYEKEPSRRRREDSLSSREWRMDSIKYAKQHGPPIKHLSRGRSVRTFRSGELITSEAKKLSELGENQMDDNVGKTHTRAEQVLMERKIHARAEQVLMDRKIHARAEQVLMDRKIHARAEEELMERKIHARAEQVLMDRKIHARAEEELMERKIHARAEQVLMERKTHARAEEELMERKIHARAEEELMERKIHARAEQVLMEKSEKKTNVHDNPSNVTKPTTFSKHSKGEMHRPKVLEGEAHKFAMSSDEDVASNIMSDGECVPHEVDKKAGEFIAKFKEQIRLQKMASIRGNAWETGL